MISFLLLLLSRRSDGPAGAHAAVDILLFLFCWFQDLPQLVMKSRGLKEDIREKSVTYLERTKQALVDTHHCTSVVEFTTVVGSAEQSYELSLGEELITVLDDLMGAAYQIHIVFLEEARDDVGTECERDTTIVLAPTRNVLVGIGPEEVTKKTAVGDLYWSAGQALSTGARREKKKKGRV